MSYYYRELSITTIKWVNFSIKGINNNKQVFLASVGSFVFSVQYNRELIYSITEPF